MTIYESPNRPRGLDAQPERPAFLGTHRAEAACARQFAVLSEDLARGATTMCLTTEKDAPAVRQSPDRCIVQLGPVAITVTWLPRNLGSVEDGELLVIVWRGSVAPRDDYLPERASFRRPTRAVTPLWEQTLKPVATSEADWVWRSRAVDPRGYSSSALAALCVEQLKSAHDNCGAADVGDSPSSTKENSEMSGAPVVRSARRAPRVA